MVIDPTITYGAIIEIGVLIIGSIGFVYAMRTTIAVLAVRLGRVETEITKLSELVASNARIDERVVAMKADNITMRADIAAMALRMMAVEARQSVPHSERQSA